MGLAVSLFAVPLVLAQDGADLPRLPNPVIIAEKLAGQLVRLDADSGELVDHALDPEQAIDHFLFYYSAGWSPTCQKFTPALVKFYTEQRAAGANFEVVFVSLDDAESGMKEHMAKTKMPWPALRFGSVKIGPDAEIEDEDEEDDRNREEPAPNPVEFVEQAAGRGAPSVVVMDSRGLILAHSYKRRKEYIGPEKPLEEFAKILADRAKELAGEKAE
jgi:thiol-disulfide isomerase/thioredoxin